jgi:hypothetical protein
VIDLTSCELALNIKSQSLHIFDAFACPHPKNWNKVERFGTGIAYNKAGFAIGQATRANSILTYDKYKLHLAT